jgi:hypothetical protein
MWFLLGFHELALALLCMLHVYLEVPYTFFNKFLITYKKRVFIFIFFL